MARKRFLKPGFFSNEDLAELPFEYRLLFQGLWCYADRDGRLEDRPKRLKAQLFPFDDVDVNAGLAELHNHGFIVRYVTKVNNADFKAIEIVNFKNHQDVHKNETESTIPTSVKIGASTEKIGTEPAIGGSSTPLDFKLDTLNLEPETLINNINNAREIEIENAIDGFVKPPISEKKVKEVARETKNIVEDIFPSLDIFRQVVSKTASWRNVIEHYGVNDAVRQLWFKLFYETKEDLHRVRYPTAEKLNANDISLNFYWWIGKGENLEKLKVLAGIKINGNSKYQHSNGKNRSEANAERSAIADKSAEFLQKFTGTDT